MSLIIGDAVDVQTLLGPVLVPHNIRCANDWKFAEQPFLEQKNSTWLDVE